MEFDSTDPEFPIRVFFLATDGDDSVADDIGTVARDMDHVEAIARETARAVMAARPEIIDWTDWEINAMSEERDGVAIDLGWFAFPPPN